MFIAEAETYWHVLTSPAHLLAELTIELFTGLLLYPVGRLVIRKAIKRHDEVHHP